MELKRWQIEKHVDISDKHLHEVLKIIGDLGLSITNVTFGVKEYDYSDSTYPVLLYSEPESDSDFEFRKQKHEEAIIAREKRDREQYEQLKKRFEPQ